jgi:WD repeat-containing protein 76
MSKEVFALDDILISSFDVLPSGRELWISDAEGSLTHTDMRQRKSRARRYQLANTKVGCVSVNPAHPEALLVSSNNRSLTYASFPCITALRLLINVYRLWDARMLSKIPVASLPTPPPSSPIRPRGSTNPGPMEVDSDAVSDFVQSKQGKGTLMAEWGHQKSVSSAYWDPSGRRIVSTCYDDTIRCEFPLYFKLNITDCGAGGMQCGTSNGVG